ncbi:phage tail protein [Gilliamella sp. Choc3-5]|uniref:tail protein X n=1 Tax=Gilliamella sp. Choc3-5 TaxID=3120236 RepID=UPI00080E73A1|nr:tail protein X [Gilliamella apicola]OCG31492.1 phage tail protein [Gilliamella apicola]
MIVYAMQNETVDALAYRVFGKTKGVVEIIYQQTPTLCELPATLPMGTAVNVPEVVPEPEKKRLNLWD